MTLLKLQLNSVRSNHLPEIVQLDQLCLGGLWTLENYHWELDNPSSVLVGLFGDDPQQVIGFASAWCILEEFHITLLMVHPDFQGKGLGQLLLYALLQSAVDQQLERATLEVKESNTGAIALYEKFGFQLAGKRPKYYQQTGEDALIFWLNGLHHPEFSEHLIFWKKEIRSKLEQSHLSWEILL